MITAKPAAASLVRSGMMHVAAGKITPSAPATSAKPMKRINATGAFSAQSIPIAAISAGAEVSFIKPAIKNIAAKAACATQNPHVTFDLDLSGHKINMVEDGLDLALRVAFKLDEGLIARKLAEITFQLVAAPSFLDHFGRPQKPDDLIDGPMLSYAHVAPDGRLKFGGANGMDVKLRPVMVSGNEHLLHLAAMAGMGFAMLPNWVTQDDLAAGRLEVVLPQTTWPKLPIQAIYADRSYLPAKVRSFLDFLAGPNGLSASLGPEHHE